MPVIMKSRTHSSGAAELPGFHLAARPLDARQGLRMSDETLEAYVRGYIESQPRPDVEFTWQGGEPLLMGLPFFEKAVQLQRHYANGKTIRNTLHTNGMLLDEAGCRFLAANGFLVGLSLDGPRELHDGERHGAFEEVTRGLDLLIQHRVSVKARVTVSRAVSQQPLEVYRFLKSRGITHLRFYPVVERVLDEVSERSVEADGYGRFLIAIYDEWIRHDVGRVQVMNFDWALAAWTRLPGTVCLHSQRCGKAALAEPDGSVYSCDRFVTPEHRLGSLRDYQVVQLMNSRQQHEFGDAKLETLPAVCRRCEVRFACHGECPKNRFAVSPDGEPGLNYLCASYLNFFRHITPTMDVMSHLMAGGHDAALVMEALKGPLIVKRRP